LAFTSNRDGNDEIVVMNADGSGRVNLTQHAAFDSHPVWSPDGSRIAFLSDRDGVASGSSVSGRSLDVFVMDADGGNLVRLGDFTSGNESSSWSWSPDGRYIVLVRHSSPCCYSDLYIANVSTGAATLFAPPGGVRYDFDPIWSPDGTRIAFDRYEGCSRLFSARVDGSDLRELTPGRCRSVEPQWSAGGGQPIVFRQAGEIFVMAADGSGVRSVSGSPRAGDTAPQWSPDGSALAFDSVRDGNYEVYVVSVDGTGLRNLTQSPGNDYLARWRPGATPAAPSVPGGGTP
jgi:TolB protein